MGSNFISRDPNLITIITWPPWIPLDSKANIESSYLVDQVSLGMVPESLRKLSTVKQTKKER